MIPDEAVEAASDEPHFPEPEPCGSYLCDEEHDGRCWTCGEPWPCTAYNEVTK